MKRDRITPERLSFALAFLRENSQIPSGGTNPVFFGSKKRLIELYKDHCNTHGQKPINRRFIIKRARWMAHVQIRKGDQFVDALWIRLKEVEAKVKSLESKAGNYLHL